MPKDDDVRNFYVNKTGVASSKLQTTKSATTLIRELIVGAGDAAPDPPELKRMLARYGLHPKIATIRSTQAATNAVIKLVRERAGIAEVAPHLPVVEPLAMPGYDRRQLVLHLPEPLDLSREQWKKLAVMTMYTLISVEQQMKRGRHKGKKTERHKKHRRL